MGWRLRLKMNEDEEEEDVIERTTAATVVYLESLDKGGENLRRV